MRLSNGERKRVVISLTPLIDVVFLLLVFFMLASTFLKFSGTTVSGASGGGTAANVRELVLIQVRGDESLLVNGRSLPTSDLAEALSDIAAKGGKRAVLKPQPGADVQDLVTVLDIARASPLESVVVVK